MPSKSKSNRRKRKTVKKPKQEWRVKPTRNWLELPPDITRNILHKVNVIDRINNAQLVCTAWRKLIEDPAMWRVVYMDKYASRYGKKLCRDMCKVAVHKSQGQLVDLTIVGFCDNQLLEFIGDRGSQLRRLVCVRYFNFLDEIWIGVFKKLPLLEELHLVASKMWKKDIETAGRHCPLLRTLKVNQGAVLSGTYSDSNDDKTLAFQNELALSIAKNLPQLTHLELVGSIMSNMGLLAILDGCPHLELLDLRCCLYIDVDGELGKRCSQQIKQFKHPDDPIDELPFISYGLYATCLTDDEIH